MKQNLLFLFFILISTRMLAQFGGGSTYDFLNLTSSARVNALGGNQVGMVDSAELTLSFYNPAALRPSMHNAISVNYIDFVSDINIGYAAYARHYEGVGTFAAGMQYINYGKFIAARENGDITGTFRAADYALNLIYSRKLNDRFYIGADLKPIYSALETYTSLGIAADLGISFVDSSGNFTAGLVAKNMGTQITTYQKNSSDREPLPFDIQAGFSQRLAHAPLQFNVTLQNLTEWNLTDKSIWDYDNAAEEEKNYNYKSDDFVKQFMRHVVLGVEFIPTKNFVIGVGYNFQRRWELSYGESSGAVGLSGGFTVKVSRFRISYAIASYHRSSTSNIFSISTNLSEFLK